MTQHNVRHRKGPTRLFKSIRPGFERHRRESEVSKRTAAHGLVTVFDVKVYFTRDLRATSSLGGLRAEDGRE